MPSAAVVSVWTLALVALPKSAAMEKSPNICAATLVSAYNSSLATWQCSPSTLLSTSSPTDARPRGERLHSLTWHLASILPSHCPQSRADPHPPNSNENIGHIEQHHGGISRSASASPCFQSSCSTCAAILFSDPAPRSLLGRPPRTSSSFSTFSVVS